MKCTSHETKYLLTLFTLHAGHIIYSQKHAGIYGTSFWTREFALEDFPFKKKKKKYTLQAIVLSLSPGRRQHILPYVSFSIDELFIIGHWRFHTHERMAVLSEIK